MGETLFNAIQKAPIDTRADLFTGKSLCIVIEGQCYPMFVDCIAMSRTRPYLDVLIS